MPAIDFDAAQKMVTMDEVMSLLGMTNYSIENGYVRCNCPRVHPGERGCCSVNRGANVWKCHKCGLAGGPFQFYMYATHLPVHNAVTELFERIGKELPLLTAPKTTAADPSTLARTRKRTGQQ